MLRDCEEGCINLFDGYCVEYFDGCCVEYFDRYCVEYFDGYCVEYHIEDISIQGAERTWTNTKQQQQTILSPKQKYKKIKGQNN